mmetsp:Transcript_19576/g.75086  ORF Transcript_19576/g.75086 Transcript_19576/m.75086 type:complete len:211 (+) Transcript_19576:784-1416(+)
MRLRRCWPGTSLWAPPRWPIACQPGIHGSAQWELREALPLGGSHTRLDLELELRFPRCALHRMPQQRALVQAARRLAPKSCGSRRSGNKQTVAVCLLWKRAGLRRGRAAAGGPPLEVKAEWRPLLVASLGPPPQRALARQQHALATSDPAEALPQRLRLLSAAREAMAIPLRQPRPPGSGATRVRRLNPLSAPWSRRRGAWRCGLCGPTA